MKAFLLLIVLLVGGLALSIYSGYYNIAASEPRLTIVGWMFETTRNRSIRHHADKAPPPPEREEAGKVGGLQSPGKRIQHSLRGMEELHPPSPSTYSGHADMRAARPLPLLREGTSTLPSHKKVGGPGQKADPSADQTEGLSVLPFRRIPVHGDPPLPGGLFLKRHPHSGSGTRFPHVFPPLWLVWYFSPSSLIFRCGEASFPSFPSRTG
jgi:hypothetical protein